MSELATPEYARELTDLIKAMAGKLVIVLKEAWRVRADQALGYASWDDYCRKEFDATQLTMPRAERREAVASMRELGMSARAIAAATGTSPQTVMRDLVAVPSQSVKPQVSTYTSHSEGTPPQQPVTSQSPAVTGLDGKPYAPHLASRSPARPAESAIAQRHKDAYLASAPQYPAQQRPGDTGYQLPAPYPAASDSERRAITGASQSATRHDLPSGQAAAPARPSLTMPAQRLSNCDTMPAPELQYPLAAQPAPRHPAYQEQLTILPPYCREIQPELEGDDKSSAVSVSWDAVLGELSVLLLTLGLTGEQIAQVMEVIDRLPDRRVS